MDERDFVRVQETTVRTMKFEIGEIWEKVKSVMLKNSQSQMLN